uniref:Peptidase C1A papain C-terminal domain-containing protein n=1 Tax=Panagrolaimus sp. ES5 TaxID=591445 RepID=A0AC34GWQ5_9BILA
MNFFSLIFFIAVLPVAVVFARTKSDQLFLQYEKAKQEIDELNKKYPSATFEINKFSFMTSEERKKYSSDGLHTSKSVNYIHFDDENITAPESYDYRDYDQVTSVKNQRYDCGSCYAFAATAAVESQYLIQEDEELDLSEEYVLECDAVDFECKGGYPAHALDAYKTLGVPTEECVPYNAANGTCPTVSCEKYKIDGYKSLGDDEDKYPGLIFKYGPAAIGMSTNEVLKQYKEGILDFPVEECNGTRHAVLLVGYTPDYWIAKNSWGDTWGESGFFRFKRGMNFCNFVTSENVVPYLSTTITTSTTSTP